MENPAYWRRQEKPLFGDLAWNFPEQKQGSIAVIGGNSNNFSSVNRAAEKLQHNYPVREILSFLPDVLQSKIPPLAGVEFFSSTESGSFAKSNVLEAGFLRADFNLLIGDFTKNAETALAIGSALKNSKVPALLTRDTIDLVLNEMNGLLERDGLVFLGSMAQIQKLFRAVYYPKVLLLSMPILPAVEALHKFTLSYDTTIITFQEGQILVASGGKVVSTPIEKTVYSPISLWSGDLATKIAAFLLFNPKKPLEAASAALLG